MIILQIKMAYLRCQSLILVFTQLLILFLAGCGNIEATVIAQDGATGQAVNVTLSPRPYPTGRLTLAPTTINPAAKSIMPQDWQYRWLKGIPCQPPCWEGITPGQTTAKDGLNILQTISYITDAKLHPPAKNETYGSLDWSWTDGGRYKRNGAFDGSYLIYEPQTTNEIIYLLRPDLPEYKFSEIVKSFGEPSHIIAVVTSDRASAGRNVFYNLYIVYLQQGFVLSNKFSSANSSKPMINSELLFGGVEFFVSGVGGLESAHQNYTKLLVPWQGYKSFDYYCREESLDFKVCNL